MILARRNRVHCTNDDEDTIANKNSLHDLYQAIQRNRVDLVIYFSFCISMSLKWSQNPIFSRFVRFSLTERDALVVLMPVEPLPFIRQCATTTSR